MARKAKLKVNDQVVYRGLAVNVIKGEYLYRGKKVVDVKDLEQTFKRVPVTAIERMPEIVNEPAPEVNEAPSEFTPQFALNKYQRVISNAYGGSMVVDVYDVLNAYQVTDPAIAHAIKKLLMPGQRGDKSTIVDLNESIQAISRSLDVHYIKEAAANRS